MLESRSAYGYYGSAGGVTGECVPEDAIYKKMKYWDYKNKYPECKNLGDYDKIEKTITVIIPSEYANRPNFGNRYTISEFRFSYSPVERNLSDVLEIRAKNYANALRHAKKWARDNNKTITGDAPGYEYQTEL